MRQKRHVCCSEICLRTGALGLQTIGSYPETIHGIGLFYELPPFFIQRMNRVLFERFVPCAAVAVLLPFPILGEDKGVPAPGETADAYPHLPGYKTRLSRGEEGIDNSIDAIFAEFEEAVSQVSSNDLRLSSLRGRPMVPPNFEAEWNRALQASFFGGESRVLRRLDDLYNTALANSHQIEVFKDLPLIRETGLQEADGAFDWEAFADARYTDSNRPTSSILDTGRAGRFLEDRAVGEYGVTKKLGTGAELTLSNRYSTLDNNSQFLLPNPQTGSELVVSLVQPLMRESGYHYQKAQVKIARLDSRMAASELVRQLEGHLLEINRAYWNVYLARAAYVQRSALVRQTRRIVGQLEARDEVDEDATASEALRANAALRRLEAQLTRSELAVKNAEARLRSLVNDPDHPLGGGGEVIPVTRPVLSSPWQDMQSVAYEALVNRAEVLQSVYQLQAGGIRRDIAKNELKPELNFVGEVGRYGLAGNRNLGGAFDDAGANDASWMVGLTLNQSLERNSQRSVYLRSEYELRQLKNRLRTTIDSVLLEALVAYREMMTAYRDMQGQYQAVIASREEMRSLQERLAQDADEDQSVGYQLQLILDALERNQVAEEEFLVSVVAYNTSFASLQRAKGTFLQHEDIQIVRDKMGDQWDDLYQLVLTRGGGKSAK